MRVSVEDIQGPGHTVRDVEPVKVFSIEDGMGLLWTLLDNAVKYTAIGGSIEVILQCNGTSAQVLVKDDGIGIPPFDLPPILDRFYRVDPSRSEANGTGLGLAIAKWIADIHQASLSVQSQQRAGSTFEVLFPRAATLVDPER